MPFSFRLLHALALLGIAAAALPSPAAVVINELHYNPPGSDDPTEFIELYNAALLPVDISGWYMSDGVTFTFPTGAIIPANGFLLLVKNPSAFSAAYPTAANVYGPYDPKSLANEGERVALSDAVGDLVAEVAYDDAPPWPTTPDGDGSSLELLNPALDGNDAASWRASLNTGGTPGATNSVFVNEVFAFTVTRDPLSPPSASNVTLYAAITSGAASNITAWYTGPAGWTSAAFSASGPAQWSCVLPARPDGTWVYYAVRAVSSNGLAYWFPPRATNVYRVMDQPLRARDLVINEIMYSSAVEAHVTPYEYVELLNVCGRTVDVAGCTFEEFRLPTNTLLLAPGAYGIITDKPDVLSNVYGALPWVISLDIGLSDNGETLRLACPNGTAISDVTYDDEAPWPATAYSFGPSLELRHPALPLTDAGSWGASAGFGTPGAPNSATTNGAVLSVLSIHTQPDPPLPNQPFWLTAHLPASTTILAVTVYYRTNAAPPFSAPMYDDGLHGDAAAADAVFGAQLPAMPAGRTVWFYLRISLAGAADIFMPPLETPAQNTPSVTLRLSYSGIETTVTPTPEWQTGTAYGQATSSRLYIYADRAGELLIDDVSLTYNAHEHLTNGTFDGSAAGWSMYGNHINSRYDSSEGMTPPGCLRLVATGPGGGSSQNHVRQDILPPLVEDGRIYTLSFAYRAAPPSPAVSNWYWLHVGTNGPRTVCINEINYHTMHDGLGDFEFIELYNYGAQSVDITQWSIENRDNLPFFITQEMIVPPGGCAVLCRALAAFTNCYSVPARVTGDLPFDMDNGRDTLTLRAWDGQLIDSVSYDDDPPWPVRADGDGATLERLSPTGLSSSATNWYASPGGGSPSAPNGSSAPAILSVWHSPAVPTPADVVTIYARTTNTTDSLCVYIRPNESANWQVIPMTPPDITGLSSAALGSFSHGTYVPFFVELSNTTTTLRFPTAGMRQPALFECDAYRDAYTLPVFRYLFTDNNWNILSSRWLWDNTDVDATLIIGTQICYNAGIHFHGNYSRSYRQAFNAYLNYGQTYCGRRKVSFVNNWENSSRLGIPAGQALYRGVNYPIFNTHPITVKLRGTQLNLMHYVEPYDDLFLLTNALPAGNVYKAAQADLQQAFFTFSGYAPTTYEHCYELHGSTDPAHQFTDLARGLEALYALPPEAFASQATQYLDAVSFAWERAMYHYLFNSDGWPQWGQNYALHCTRDSGMHILPQDIGAIGVWYGWRLFPTVAGIQRFMRLPDVMRPFWHIYTNLYYGRATLATQHALVEQFYRQCSNDVNRYYGNSSTFRSYATSFKNSLQNWNSSVTGFEKADIGPVGIVNWQLVWLSQPNRCALPNTPYWYHATALDTANRSISYTKHIGAAWLTLNPATGELTGTPSAPGSYPVLITAYNGSMTLTQAWTIAVQEPAPCAIFKFDEAGGSVVSDATVFAHHGSLQGNIVREPGGRYGACLYVGASAGDRVYVPGSDALTPAGDFSVEAWIKFTQFNKPKAQVFKKYEEFGFEMGQDDTIMGGRFWYGPFDDGATRNDGLNGHGYALMRYHPDAAARILTTNVWHHLAVTHERDRNEVYIYVNGQRIGGLVWENNLLGSSSDPLYIGGPFDGWIDEFKLLGFARKAFNPGLSIEAVRYASPRQYVQLRYFNRGNVPPIALRNFALRAEPSGVWAPLPDITLTPGADVRINLSDLPGLSSLPASGALALYPFEPGTIWPSGNYEHVCTKILDYVAWGTPDAAPDTAHPAVQAGLWQPYGLVSTLSDASGRITLITPGRNDHGVYSWNNGGIVPEPAAAGVFLMLCLPCFRVYAARAAARGAHRTYGT